MRSRLACVGLCVLLIACAAVPNVASQDAPPPTVVPASPPEPAKNSQVHLLLGLGQLDNDRWVETDQPFLIGGEFIYQGRDSWLGLEFGARLGSDYAEAGNVEATLFTSEIYAGPAMLFLRDSPVQPYIGAGVSLVLVYYDEEQGFLTFEDDDVSLGFYAHAGLAFRIGKYLVGFDARVLTGTDLDLLGVPIDVDGQQYAFFFGFGA